MTTEPTPTVTPPTKIVIVSGQEFSVPATATIDELRQHLAPMFPDVTTATPTHGKKTIDGVEYVTIEFVKRAGTKGASELVPLLATIPALRLSPPRSAVLDLLSRVRNGTCTIAEALDADLAASIAALPESSLRISGATLCAQLDSLSPVAAADAAAW